MIINFCNLNLKGSYQEEEYNATCGTEGSRVEVLNQNNVNINSNLSMDDIIFMPIDSCNLYYLKFIDLYCINIRNSIKNNKSIILFVILDLIDLFESKGEGEKKTLLYLLMSLCLFSNDDQKLLLSYYKYNNQNHDFIEKIAEMLLVIVQLIFSTKDKQLTIVIDNILKTLLCEIAFNIFQVFLNKKQKSEFDRNTFFKFVYYFEKLLVIMKNNIEEINVKNFVVDKDYMMAFVGTSYMEQQIEILSTNLSKVKQNNKINENYIIINGNIQILKDIVSEEINKNK